MIVFLNSNATLVEKLQLLNTPEERMRRLNSVPEIHSDPHMDPDSESADEEEQEDKKKGSNLAGSLSLLLPGLHIPLDA